MLNRSQFVLVALLITIGCGEETAPNVQLVQPAPVAAALPRQNANLEDVRKKRGEEMLARELAYLAGKQTADAHGIEVAAKQVRRTIGWLELRKVPVHPALSNIKTNIDGALMDEPGDPPEEPVKPTMDDQDQLGSAYTIRGAYMGDYQGGEGSGTTISTSTGPVVVLLAGYPDDVAYGDPVQACGTLLEYREDVVIRQKWAEARFYQRAGREECILARKARKASAKSRKAALKGAMALYKAALAEYETQLAEHDYRVSNFAQIKQAALAGLPAAANQAVSALR